VFCNAAVKFLTQVAFPAFGGTPEIFRIFGGKTTRASVSTSALKQFCRACFVACAPQAFPQMLKLLWLKTPFVRTLPAALLLFGIFGLT
jgi:hypothetical protein